MDDEEFSVLQGQVIREITGLRKYSDEVLITLADGRQYRMHHRQSCCESVSIEDVCGDAADVTDSPVILAECVSSGVNPNPRPVCEDRDSDDYEWSRPESERWTFYKLVTMKGAVTIRWYGRSNGWYSIVVSFERVVEESEDEG